MRLNRATTLGAVGAGLLVAMLAVAPARAANPSSANYAIAPTLLNAGVGPMTSASYRLSSSLGAPFATRPVFSTNYRIGFGLWPGGTPAGAASLVNAASRKQHGAAGNFDLALSLLSSNPTVEPRKGATATIALTFDKPIASASVAVTEGSASFTGLTTAGYDAVLSFTGITNGQWVTLKLTNITASDGQTGGAATVRLGFLKGDITGNRQVTLADLLGVNAVLAQLVTSATFLKDVDASGTLTLADVLLVNANLAQSLPSP